MKCPHCQSANIQSHVITEDKHSRNTKIMIAAVLLPIIILSVIFLMLGETNLFIPIIIGVVIGAPLFLILKIVLIIIPARNKTVFVCNECGAEFKKSEALDDEND